MKNKIFTLAVTALVLCGCENKVKSSSTSSSVSAPQKSPEVSVQTASSAMESDRLSTADSESISEDLSKEQKKKPPQNVGDVLKLFPMKKIVSADVQDTTQGSEVTFRDADGNKVVIPKVFASIAPKAKEANGVLFIRIPTRIHRIALTLLVDTSKQNKVYGLKSSGFHHLDLNSIQVVAQESGEKVIEVAGIMADRKEAVAVISKDADGNLVISQK